MWNNGDISCTAELFISIKPGFHAKAGSVFHAQIKPVNYIYCPPGMMMESGEMNDNYSNIEEDDLNSIVEIDKNESFYIIYPNQREGAFYISANDNHNVYIEIFSITGQQIWSGNDITNNAIDVNLSKGVYVIQIINFGYKIIDLLIIVVNQVCFTCGFLVN